MARVWIDRDWRRHPKGCCKRLVNETTLDHHDLERLVSGAFAATGLVQTGGWQVRIYYSRTGLPHADWIVPHRFRWDGKNRVHWHFELAVTKGDVDVGMINQWAGLIQRLVSFSSDDWWRQDTRWSDQLKMREKPIKPKLTTAQRVSQREAHARKMLLRAERDEARASVRVAKWAAKVKYYDKQEAKR